ncbi:MAG TPA: hypothetical protein DDX98_01585 [Bacteroidales bacterium]|nr:hypothetical protein [Bacteroidales bacterium]
MYPILPDPASQKSTITKNKGKAKINQNIIECLVFFLFEPFIVLSLLPINQPKNFNRWNYLQKKYSSLRTKGIIILVPKKQKHVVFCLQKY